ncbi:MAG: GNAT family N-acetyltransferase, partial [Phormidesmis sp. CAN_BIN44]|nr:GNAT family N-acetyltransferase [Phormidesmis sp. CAN_BIN44]
MNQTHLPTHTLRVNSRFNIMIRAFPQTTNIVIRPIQYRDLESVEQLCAETADPESPDCLMVREKPLAIRRWYGILKVLSLFPNPFQNSFCIHVAELNQQIKGFIQVSPFNRTGTTWRVDRVAVDAVMVQNTTELEEVEDAETSTAASSLVTSSDISSLLLRYCLEKIWQARTWILEIDINDKSALALYRKNGFQRLAHMTYWGIAP